MGLFNYVNFEMRCPSCDSWVTYFQTKQGVSCLSAVDPNQITHFYARCESCGLWIDFFRDSLPNPDKVYHRGEVEDLGFRMTTQEKKP